MIKQDYVTKAEFEPVRNNYVSIEKLETVIATFKPATSIVEGGVKVVLTALLASILAVIGLKNL